MSGTILEDRSPVTRSSMVDKCVEVLEAGGTVYLGETHNTRHGREICIDVLQKRCVQHLCLEFDTEVDEFVHQHPEVLDTAESVLGHKPKVAMSNVVAACTSSGASYHLVDANQKYKKDPDLRQIHISTQVANFRRQVSMVGRGVLVLIGSDHLKDLTTGKDRWTALPKLVYDGTSFMHGVFQDCVMVWQLS